jgi:hypothetical protein
MRIANYASIEKTYGQKYSIDPEQVAIDDAINAILTAHPPPTMEQPPLQRNIFR